MDMPPKKERVDKSTQTSFPETSQPSVYPQAPERNPRNLRRLPPLVNKPAVKPGKSIQEQGGQNTVNLTPKPGRRLPLEEKKTSLVFPRIENQLKKRKPRVKTVLPKLGKEALVHSLPEPSFKKRNFRIRTLKPGQNNPILNVPSPKK
jgi:hypothetical protein